MVKNSNALSIKEGLEGLKDLGVRKLRNFGFINVTRENILVDEVYCFFFMRFLDSIKGQNTELDHHIKTIINSIEK